MLNKMQDRLKCAEATDESPVLKQAEGNSQMLWVSTKGGNCSLEDMLIQIETAATNAFQNEKKLSGDEPKDDKKVFIEIANDLINKYSGPKSGTGTDNQNDNANPAEADTRG